MQVTGLTAARMLEIEAASVVDGEVVGDNLILKRFDNTEIDAGDVRGPQGIQGDPGVDGEVFHGDLDPGDVIDWGDVNLYRVAANALKTDDDLQVVGTLFANKGTASEVTIGGSGFAGLWFGSGNDTNLYRSAADILKTADQFQAVGLIRANADAATRVGIGAVGPGGVAGIIFSSADDVNLYRSAADILKTDDVLYVGGSIRASQGAADQVIIGGSGAAIQFGSSADTNLYRSAADTLKTDDAFYAVGNIRTDGFVDVGGATLGAYLDIRAGLSGVPGIRVAALHVTNSPLVDAYLTATDAEPNFRIARDGKIEIGAGGATALDTNLYRSAANTLKTDDSFHSTEYIYAHSGTGAQLRIGSTAAIGAGVLFGNAEDTNLYRNAANELKTDDHLTVALTLSVLQAATLNAGLYVNSGATLVQIYTDGKMYFGSAGDTNLYRSASDVLKTDDSFQAAGSAGVVTTMGGREIYLGGYGPASEPGIRFGSAQDTNLYRGGANLLKTDDAFSCAGQYFESLNDAFIRTGTVAVTLGARGPATQAGLTMGGDVNLYRAAANNLATDDQLDVVLDIWARSGGVAEVRMGAQGPASEAGLKFGSAGDTNLYRSAANTLKTDDSLEVAGTSGISATYDIRARGFTITGSGGTTGTLTFESEQTGDPAAPAANRAVMFTKDNGAGKTQVCVRFATGAVQVLATEP